MNPLLHALLGVSTFFVLISSWWMMALPLPSKIFTYRAFPFQLHKNVGMTMAVMLLVMLYGRLMHLRAARAKAGPRMPMSAVVQSVLLYGLVFVCCLSGYLSSVYSGWATRLWWVVTLPNWGYDNDVLNEFYSEIHIWSTLGVIAFMVLHIGTATYRVFRQDRSVRWMLRL